MTSDEVGEELRNVIHALNNSIKVRPSIPQMNISSLSKEDRVAKLREYRRLYFKKDPTAKPRLEEKAKEAFLELYPETVEELSSTISSSRLLSLSASVKSMARYTTPQRQRN